ncbi:hypothetical protein HORM4_460016 [Vibrio harveyi]|nr:hypothetical protein HORM4_460016 [Vibrio harveyi]
MSLPFICCSSFSLLEPISQQYYLEMYLIDRSHFSLKLLLPNYND